MKDALGQELVLGNIYGFATSGSGTNDVVVGVLLGIGSEMAHLGDVKRFHYVYGQRQGESSKIAKKTSVKSFRLFPVPRETYEMLDIGENEEDHNG